MSKSINILFVHPLEGNAYEVFKAFERVENVNIIPLIEKSKKVKNSFISKVRHKLRLQQDLYHINDALLSYDFSEIGIVFVVKGNEIYPHTLKKLKATHPHLKFINWSLDDMFAHHNRSIFYSMSLKLYDMVVTCKSYNVIELKTLGAKKILLQNQAFSKDIHKPHDGCTNEFSDKVVFIGFPEKERNQSMMYLAENGVKVDIYGYPEAWGKIDYTHENITLHAKSLYGEEYAKALSCAKISLCFLRKKNRDLQTSRSIEIPACGGFMLAERTNEHLELFEEDKEAVYFETDEELLKKVKYYLENDEERIEMQRNGYKRCITSGYSYNDRVKEILNEVLYES
jgi:spore maturation protein CgeB